MKRIICYALMMAIMLSVVPEFLPEAVSVARAAYDDGGRVSKGWETVYFGNYWQSDTNGDGVADRNDDKQPICWRVLSRNGAYALLLSDRILDAGKFYAGGDAASWEKSDLRNWLNTAFYQEAFRDIEREVISVCELSNEGNENTWGITTNNTKDKVFVLSYEDACRVSYGFAGNSYTDVSDDRMAALTEYAATKPGMYSEAGSSDTWWLRNSGLTEETAYKVLINGIIDPFNSPVNTISGIRPAIYVDLSDTALWTAGKTITAEKLPYGENINGNMRDDAGNLPISNELPEWMGNVSQEPRPTAAPTDETAAPSATPDVGLSTGGGSNGTNSSLSPNSAQTPAKIKPIATKKSPTLPQIKVIPKPKKVQLTQVKALGKGRAKAVWKWSVNQDGYQFQYAMNRSFTKKRKTYNKNMVVSDVTLKNLKKGKTYYFRVRAYNEDGYRKKYGSWSNVRKIRVR